MAQIKKVEKFQNGGSTPSKYKFKVDNSDYEVDDNVLDSSFDSAFQKLVDSGYARKNDREAWNERFQTWKSQAKNGIYNIDMQGDNVGSLSYSGGSLSNDNAGLNSKNKDAKSNLIGRLVGGVDDKDKQMSLLNGLLSENIGREALGKFAQDKLKSEQDEKTKKADKLTSDKQFINKYNTFSDVGTSLYGDEGDENWRLEEYWKDKDGQTTKYASALNNLFNHVMDSKYDDKDLQKLFKDNTGKDINQLRNYLKEYGYNNDGSFIKNFDFKKTYDLRNKFDILASHQKYLDRNSFNKLKQQTEQNGAGAESGSQLNDSGNPQTTKLNKVGKYWSDGNSLFLDENGQTPFDGVDNRALYKAGKKYTGVNIGDLNDEFAWEDDLTGFYIDGAKAKSKSDFENYLKKINNPEQLNAYQTKMQEINAKRNAAFSRMTSLSTFNGENTGSNYAFKDLLDKGLNPESAEEISGLFSKYANNPNFRLYQYKVSGKDRLEGQGLIRHRIVQNNNRYDGVIKKGLDGKYYLKQKNGVKRLLGDLDGDNSVKRQNPFYLEQGGKIVKAQLGSVLNQTTPSEQSTKFKSASNSNVYNALNDKNYKLSSADKWELGSLLADVTGLGLSLTGVGSIGAGITGAAGTTAHLVSNIKRDGLDWGDAGEALLGYGLDAVSVIPGLGIAGKTGKIVNGLRKASKWLGVAMAGVGATAAVSSLAKIGDPSKMSIDDWKNITVGLQSVLSGKRILDNTIATRNVKLNTVKANGKNFNLTGDDLSSIKSAKTLDDKVRLAKTAISNSSAGKLKFDDINLDLKTNKSLLNKASFGKFGKSTQELDLATTNNGRALKDYDSADWYTKRAIKNTVALNPNITGANELLGKKYVVGDGSYDKVSDWNSGLGLFGNKTRMKGNPLTEGSYKPITNEERILSDITTKQGIAGERINPSVNYKGSDNQNISETIKQSKKNVNFSVKNNSKKDDINIAELRQQLLGSSNSKARKEITSLLNTKDPVVQKKLQDIFTSDASPNSMIGKIKTKLETAFAEKNMTGKKKFIRLQQGGLVNFKRPLIAYGNRTAPGDIKTAVNMSANPIKVQDKTFVNIPTQQPLMNTQSNSGLLSSMIAPKNPIPSNAPKVESKSTIKRNPNINRSVTDKNVARTTPILPNLTSTPRISDSINQPNIGININGSGAAPSVNNKVGLTNIKNGSNSGSGFKFTPDLQTASELARALFIRNNNKNLDYNVKPAILDHVLEVPNQVKGDLYTKNLFDKRATNLVRNSNIPSTSDSMLETAKQLSINQQADQIRTQGLMADVDALNRSKLLNEQLGQSYAQGRQAISNQNRQSLAAADEANRQNNNIKMQAMNQPIDSFWAAQNQKLGIKQQQNQLYDRELQKLNINGVTAPMIKDLQTKMSNLQNQIDLDKGRNIATDELEKQYQDLQEQASQFQIKQQFANLHMAKSPGMKIDPNFYKYTKGWNPQVGFGNSNSASSNSINSIGVKKKGGVIDLLKEEEKTRREMMKDANRGKRDIVKTFNNWMSQKQRIESNERISASNNVNQIIKLALGK